MKRLRQGQQVRIANPVSIAARFWSNDHAAIIGAGGQLVDRQLLDGPAWVFCLADNCKGQRGLIVFGSQDSNIGMWLGVESLASGTTHA